MSACPNCGRQTLRTKDWACQWCGYPLVSKSYKPIDKTYKELQEERSLALKPIQPESPPDQVPELAAEPEVAPEQEEEPEVAPEPEAEPEPLITPPPEPKEELPPATEPEVDVEPEEAPEPEAEAEPLITPPPEPKEELPPATEPEVEVEPEAAPATEVKLEDIQDGMEITADQINALFKSDKAGAHEKFAEKTMVIKGKVGKVFVREHLEIRYIVLTGTQKRMTWSLRCTFDKESSSKLTGLKEGEAVTVRGKYDGYSKNIIFKECTLV
jgi:hypothetical protein